MALAACAGMSLSASCCVMPPMQHMSHGSHGKDHKQPDQPNQPTACHAVTGCSDKKKQRGGS